MDNFPYKIYYGTDETKINVTDLLLNKSNLSLENSNKSHYDVKIPWGDKQRADIFGDPVPYQLKSIYI